MFGIEAGFPTVLLMGLPIGHPIEFAVELNANANYNANTNTNVVTSRTMHYYRSITQYNMKESGGGEDLINVGG